MGYGHRMLFKSQISSYKSINLSPKIHIVRETLILTTNLVMLKKICLIQNAIVSYKDNHAVVTASTNVQKFFFEIGKGNLRQGQNQRNKQLNSPLLPQTIFIRLMRGAVKKNQSLGVDNSDLKTSQEDSQLFPKICRIIDLIMSLECTNLVIFFTTP